MSFGATGFGFDFEKQKSFIEGKVYVTFSKTININNLFVIGSCNHIQLKLIEVSPLNITGYNKKAIRIIRININTN